MSEKVDLSAPLARLRHAQAADPVPDWPLRADRLRRLQRMLQDCRNDFATAIDQDFGVRPAEETDLLELVPSLSAVRHALRHGRGWMRPRRRPAGLVFLPATTEQRPQPRGVVGIIVPWNYPLFLAVGPLVDALAAGNRVMIKMSEYTPRFSARFAEAIGAHFASDEVVVVNGDAAVARAFASLPFDHLLFTGSTAVGQHVMRAAAANLTPVTLELGGKSPAIVGPGADLPQAVDSILYGKLLNAGQTCVAPDYVLLPRAQLDEFVQLARATVDRLYPDLAQGGHYTTIATADHYQRLCNLRTTAEAAGARVQRLSNAEDDAGRRLLVPAILREVNEHMPVMREEIFGPLLPLVPYDDLEQALDYVTARPHPLALYLFEHDRERIDRVLSRTRSGGVTLNDTIYHIVQHNLPFGGVGPSGMGGYHGEAGFRTFSHVKPVFRQARWNAAALMRPPYGERFRQLLAVLLRHA